jgi:phage baseplate assembly protein W
MQLITHPLPSVRVQKLEYSEHIRQKLNSILEIPEGRNYWEKEFRTVKYENKLKEYLQH